MNNNNPKIMNELIKIYDHKEKRVVSARELHEFLESKQEFTSWIKSRIEKYGFIEDQDYTSFDKIIKRQTGASKRKEYAVSTDMAKELSMVENNDKGKQARRYFIEMEKLAISKAVYLPSRKELAQMVIEQETKIEALAEENKMNEQLLVCKSRQLHEQEPKVNFAEAVEKTNDTILVRELAKYISNVSHEKVGQGRLFEWLRKEKIVMTGKSTRDRKHNEPYQRYIDMDIFKVSVVNVQKTDVSLTVDHWRITGKGRVYLLNRYLKAHGLSKLNF